MKALIISNGSIEDYTYLKENIKDCQLVVCADGGVRHARRLELIPDAVIGDFDSIEESHFNSLRNDGTELISYPPMKDQTDTQLAVEYAIEKGCKELVLIGSIGSRFDHSFANVSLLKMILDKGCKGSIVNENNRIFLIDHSILLYGDVGMEVSLLPITEKVTGITTSGLLYALENAEMQLGIPYGISNVFTVPQMSVEIKSGLLLVIIAKD